MLRFIKAKMERYFAIFKIAVKDAWIFRNRFLAQTIVNSLRVAVLTALYYYVFKYLGAENVTISLATAVWSIALYMTFMSLRVRKVFNEINYDVRFGQIETFLLKPVNYLAYKMWYQLGDGILAFITTVLLLFLMLSLFVGFPVIEISWLFVLEALLILVLGVALILVIYSLTGISAFWLEEAKPVYWLIDKTIMVLGGSYLPIAFFPESLKSVVYYSPFGAALFINQIPYSNFPTNAPSLILIQIFWLIVLGTFLILIFQVAKQKLNVNGG